MKQESAGGRRVIRQEAAQPLRFAVAGVRFEGDLDGQDSPSMLDDKVDLRALTGAPEVEPRRVPTRR